MTPSVEGNAKVRVVGLLLLSGVSSAAVAGFAGGIFWTVSPLPGLDVTMIVVAAGTAVVLDVGHRATGRLRPPSVGRQVPQDWSRVFDPPVVAVLYGARLGVGPLTILNSWSWWAAFLVGAAGGPAVGALVGVGFAVSRTVVMIAVGEWARGAMAAQMGRVRGGDRLAHLGCALGTAALAVAVVVV